MSKEDDEKFWNFIIFGFWGTDIEFTKAAPYILGATVIIVGLIFLLCA